MPPFSTMPACLKKLPAPASAASAPYQRQRHHRRRHRHPRLRPGRRSGRYDRRRRRGRFHRRHRADHLVHQLSTTGGVVNCTDELKGTGVIKLGGLGVVNLLGGSTSTQTVDFQPSFGALDLAVPLIYQGIIAGFAPGDTIDLVLTPETTFTYASNVLTVFDGSIPVANLHFSGDYLQTHFTLTPDTAGGTIIGYTS